VQVEVLEREAIVYHVTPPAPAAPAPEESSLGAAAIVFATLPDMGMRQMTPGGVEFVLCPSALTASV
jgi:hypothetical protein